MRFLFTARAASPVKHEQEYDHLLFIRSVEWKSGTAILSADMCREPVLTWPRVESGAVRGLPSRKLLAVKRLHPGMWWQARGRLRGRRLILTGNRPLR